jgi:putative transposase
MQRVEPLISGQVYHVMNKSIAGYKIFHVAADYQRLVQLIRFFQLAVPLPKFSQFVQSAYVTTHGFEQSLQEQRAASKGKLQAKLIAYCIMPTHLHLIIQPLHQQGATSFLGNIFNSYARYFNTKHHRRGPLWVGRFKNVTVKTDEQLLHLTRYLHLNPTSAGLVRRPAEWYYSSYQEYIAPETITFPVCHYQEVISMKPAKYRAFVEEHVVHQRELAIIKKLALE